MTDSLKGSYQLEAATIDRVVTQRSPGAYVLGDKANGRVFSIAYVGRAESNLNVRLKQQVGVYSAFMFQYCASPKEAFESECKVFHTFAPPDNKSHPTRPPNTDWQCPNCKNFG
jgi:hypothetical protein